MRLHAALLAALLIAPAAGAAEPKLDAHFAPIAFLVDHCWRADFPGGKLHDVQCFQSMYGGKLVHNTHEVNSDPPYRGTSVFSWDATNKRIRFHYFTSTGAVSEGYFDQRPDGIVIPERHVGDDGRVTVMESSYQPDGKKAYRVVTREQTATGWVERRNLRYVRVDALKGTHRTP